jgi:AcrR family transcriptional regulator
MNEIPDPIPGPSKGTPNPGVRRRRKEARPRELLAAALDVFSEKGFAAARIEDIADRAGVGKGTIYLYFRTKESLFEAVIREGLDAAVTAAEALTTEAHGPACDLLRDLVLGWKRSIAATSLGRLLRLVIAESDHFPELAAEFYQRIIDAGHRLISQAIDVGIARGEFRRVNAANAAWLVLSPLCWSLLAEYGLRAGTSEPWEAMCPVPQSIELLVQGLAKV